HHACSVPVFPPRSGSQGPGGPRTTTPPKGRTPPAAMVLPAALVPPPDPPKPQVCTVMVVFGEPIVKVFRKTSSGVSAVPVQEMAPPPVVVQDETVFGRAG